MYTTGQTLLKLSDISLNFGEKKVLRNLNLEVKDIVGESSIGQVITLVGRSGIGKSKLFQIIAGLLAPTTGTIQIGYDQLPVKPGVVGMVLQNYPLYKHRTLRSNLDLVCKDKARIDEYLHDFDLYEHRDKYPEEMSGGQKQRTAIVQQLLCSEHFILLDEPFSGLDPMAIDKLCSIISKVAHKDTENTIIISSHILEPSIAISDTIWMLGNEFGVEGKIDGANIRHIDDLAAQGLAWNPNIRRDPRFAHKIEEIRTIFKQI